MRLASGPHAANDPVAWWLRTTPGQVRNCSGMTSDRARRRGSRVERRPRRPYGVPPGPRHGRLLPAGRIGARGVSRHHYGAIGADHRQQRPNHRRRPAADPAQRAERGVHQHRHTRSQPERAQIRHQRLLSYRPVGCRYHFGLWHRLANTPDDATGTAAGAREVPARERCRRPSNATGWPSRRKASAARGKSVTCWKPCTRAATAPSSLGSTVPGSPHQLGTCHCGGRVVEHRPSPLLCRLPAA